MDPLNLALGIFGIVSATTATMLALQKGGKKMEKGLYDMDKRVSQVEGQVQTIERILTIEISNIRETMKKQGEENKTDFARLERKMDMMFRPTGDYRGGE